MKRKGGALGRKRRRERRGCCRREVLVREGVEGSAEEASDWYSGSAMGASGLVRERSRQRGKKAKRGLGRWVRGWAGRRRARWCRGRDCRVEMRELEF